MIKPDRSRVPIELANEYAPPLPEVVLKTVPTASVSTTFAPTIGTPVPESSTRPLTVVGVNEMFCVVVTPLTTCARTVVGGRGSVDYALMRRWALPIVVGSLAGSLAAASADARVLAAVFGVVALVAALKMLLPLDHVVLSRSVPGGVAGAAIPAAIGAVSAMMGIGGGTLSVPTMTLCGEPVHKAVGTAALTGLWISIPATLGYLLAPAHDAAGIPWTVGYVSLAGFAVIAPVAWLLAPLGARLAHSMDRRRLSVAFGLFLSLVAARMLYRALG